MRLSPFSVYQVGAEQKLNFVSEGIFTKILPALELVSSQKKTILGIITPQGPLYFETIHWTACSNLGYERAVQ